MQRMPRFGLMVIALTAMVGQACSDDGSSPAPGDGGTFDARLAEAETPDAGQPGGEDLVEQPDIASLPDVDPLIDVIPHDLLPDSEDSLDLHPDEVQDVSLELSDDVNEEDLEIDEGCSGDDECDDGNPCTSGACQEGGECLFEQVADGVDCEADGLCVGQCMSGECAETAVEICDGEDNDCDGEVDELGDSDEDGFVDCEDCAPLDPAISPDAKEVCWNSVDDDCNGWVDDADPDCSLTEGLALHLPFDILVGSVFPDKVGEHHGIVKGGVEVVDGPVGSGASFDGTDDFVSVVAMETLPQGTQQSVAMWFKAVPAWRPQTLFQRECYRDLNDDGYPDVVFTNSHNGFSDATNSSVYWGSEEGFSEDNRLLLPTFHPKGTVSADLNGDGYLELLFANNKFQQNSTIGVFIYWGSPEGFVSANKTVLPAWGASALSIADVNLAGLFDIVVRQERADQAPEAGSFIYWGSPDGYGPDNRLLLPTEPSGAHANNVADLNRDGFPDIVLSVTNKEETWAMDSRVYWGTADGLNTEDITLLPTQGAVGNTTVDLNGDGYLEIIFSNLQIEETHDLDSYVYWGGPEGFDPDNPGLLPAHGPKANSVTDFDGDGFPDILISNSISDFDNQVRSVLYYGSVSGYSTDATTEVYSDGAHGHAIADLNLDGHLDVAMCSKYDEKPTGVKSQILWGTENGFDNVGFQELPSGSCVGATVPGSPLNNASAAYGTQPSDYGSFNLHLADGQVILSNADYRSRYFTLAADYPADGWNHVTATFDMETGEQRLYLNGELAAEATVDALAGTMPPWRLRVGSDTENSTKLSGDLDELRVYDRVLTPVEAAYLFSNP